MTCPRKYRYQYIDKIPVATKQANMSFILGNSVHNALEKLYNHVTPTSIPTEDELMDRYLTIWKEELDDAIQRAWWDNPFTEEMTSTQQEYGMEFLQWYYREYAPFDQDITMQTEMNISGNITPEITFSGKIDRVAVDGDTLIIYDYKTSKSYDPDNNDKVKKQLTLYGWLLYNTYKDKCHKIIAKAVYLRLHNTISRELTPDIMDAMLAEYQALADEILSKQEQYLSTLTDPATKEELFPVNGGSHCSFCDFQAHCPLYKHQFADDHEVTLDDASTSTVKKMIDSYRHVSEQKKALENKLAVYKQLLVQYAQEHGYKRLYGNTTKLTVTYRSSYKHHQELVEELKNTRSTLWNVDDILRINDHAINQHIKDNTIPYEQVQEFVYRDDIVYLGWSSLLKAEDIARLEDQTGE